MAAIAAPPHLVAAFVIVAGNDTAFVGGAFKQRDMGDWNRGQGVAEERIRSSAASYVATALSVTGDVLHNARFIHIPIYNYGGWYDLFSVGNVRNFQQLQNHGSRGARGHQKLEMGPFGHGDMAGDLAYPNGSELLAGATDEIRWFDYWLKGVDNGIMDEPPVRIYMMASARKGALSPKNRWLRFANWPPAPQIVDYFLHEDGSLSRKAPTEASASRAYDFDPANPVPTHGGSNLTFEKGPMDQRPIGERQDYLRFSTAALERDVAIAGPVSLELWASTDGPDTDFMAKLVDVYPAMVLLRDAFFNRPAAAYLDPTYCSWSGGPVNAFTLWKPGAVQVTKGAEHLATYQKTEISQRQYCTKCGSHLMTNHPTLALVDVFAATLPTLNFAPGVHVNYAETVLPMRDGLPKLKDFPKELGGSGESVPE